MIEIDSMHWYYSQPTTGTDGRARLSFEAPSADRLRLRARVRDAQGQISTHRSTVWIARSAEDLDQANLLPAPEERGFFVFPDELKTPGPHLTQDFNASILPDRIAYRAGETARFLLRTRNPGSTYLFCVQSQNFRVLRTVTLGAGDQIVEGGGDGTGEQHERRVGQGAKVERSVQVPA